MVLEARPSPYGRFGWSCRNYAPRARSGLRFLGFALGDRAIKVMGIGLATAVFIDATIVRVIMVPATMELFGDRNWWFPRWLDRTIPKLNVEAHHTVEEERYELVP